MGIYDAEINDFPLIKCLWTLYEIFSELGLCYPCHLGVSPYVISKGATWMTAKFCKY